MKYKRVLLIDDDDVDIFISERILKSALFAEEIVSKSSVTAALEYLESLAATPLKLPEIIFVDLKMPEKDGFDFIDEFNRLNDLIKSLCKIVVLTNLITPDPNTLKHFKSFPFIQKVVNKPLTSEALGSI